MTPIVRVCKHAKCAPRVCTLGDRISRARIIEFNRREVFRSVGRLKPGIRGFEFV